MFPIIGKPKDEASTDDMVCLLLPALPSLQCPLPILRLVLTWLQEAHALITTTGEEILEKEGKISPNHPPNLPLYPIGLNWVIDLFWPPKVALLVSI